MEYPIEIGVLGPLSLVIRGADSTPSADKQRKLLSVLLVNQDRLVPVSSLIEEIWGDSPPRSASTIVQTYVLSIRKNIANNLGVPSDEVARLLLKTRNKGYEFDTHLCSFDLREYRRLVEAGKQAVQVGDDHTAVRVLRAADGLWRGSALVDVELGAHLEVEVARLDQCRIGTVELRVEAELRLGRYREVCTDLAALVIRHPYHERLHAYFMYALARVGLRSQALEVFQKLRTSLVGELGLEPCWKVRKLHQQILDAGDFSATDVLEFTPSYLTGIFQPEPDAHIGGHERGPREHHPKRAQPRLVVRHAVRYA